MDDYVDNYCIDKRESHAPVRNCAICSYFVFVCRLFSQSAFLQIPLLERTVGSFFPRSRALAMWDVALSTMAPIDRWSFFFSFQQTKGFPSLSLRRIPCRMAMLASPFSKRRKSLCESRPAPPFVPRPPFCALLELHWSFTTNMLAWMEAGLSIRSCTRVLVRSFSSLRR